MTTILVYQIYYYNNEEDRLINFLNQNGAAPIVGIDQIDKLCKNTFAITRSGITQYYNFVYCDRSNNLNVEKAIIHYRRHKKQELEIIFEKEFCGATQVAKIITGLENYENVYYHYNFSNFHNDNFKVLTKPLKSADDYLDVAMHRNLPEREKSRSMWKLSLAYPTIDKMQDTILDKKLKQIIYYQQLIDKLNKEVLELRLEKLKL